MPGKTQLVPEVDGIRNLAPGDYLTVRQTYPLGVEGGGRVAVRFPPGGAGICGAAKFSARLEKAMRRGEFPPPGGTQSARTSVPAVMSTAPIAALREKASWRKTKANSKVNTMLSLSMGTTLEASPSWRAR